jgi:hypothetical protein
MIGAFAQQGERRGLEHRVRYLSSLIPNTSLSAANRPASFLILIARFAILNEWSIKASHSCTIDDYGYFNRRALQTARRYWWSVVVDLPR